MLWLRDGREDTIVASKKQPDSGLDLLRPKFGIPAVLAQSDRVVAAFGQRLGFVVIILAIAGCAGVTGTTVILLGGLLFR
jgi:hypothetical protein